jgi:hypothetical protein
MERLLAQPEHTNMNRLTLAALATVLAMAGAATADARPFKIGNCPNWFCGVNGVHLTGIALQGDTLAGIKLDSVTVVLPR